MSDDPVAAGWTGFIYILKGTLIVGDATLAYEQHNTLVLSTNANETGVLLKSGSNDTEFMLVRPVLLTRSVLISIVG